jgi:hypothetical protein
MYDYPCDTLLLLGQKALFLQIVVLISPLIIVFLQKRGYNPSQNARSCYFQQEQS